jgi:hypothetical protein
VLYRWIFQHLKWNLKTYIWNRNKLGCQITLNVITMILNIKHEQAVSHREQFILFPVYVKLYLHLIYTCSFCAATFNSSLIIIQSKRMRNKPFNFKCINLNWGEHHNDWYTGTTWTYIKCPNIGYTILILINILTLHMKNWLWLKKMATQNWLRQKRAILDTRNRAWLEIGILHTRHGRALKL